MGRRTIVLVIAIVLAAVSAYAVWSYLTSVESDIRADIAEVRVYRATEPIEPKLPGEEARPFIEESFAMVQYVAFETSTIICEGPKPENEGKDPAEYGCPDNPRDLDTTLSGKVAAGPISPGQLITTDQWVELAAFEDVSLSEEIEQGKVAISVRPEDVASAGGFIRPGDHVNLIASASVSIATYKALLAEPSVREFVFGTDFGFETEPSATPAPAETTDDATGTGTGTGGEPADPLAAYADSLDDEVNFTQTILQDVEVLAVGADTPPNRIGSGLEPVGTQIIVLEVTPAQAEQIEFARQYTSVAMTLLPSDVPYTPFESTGVIVEDLFTLIDRIEAQVEAAFGGTGS